MADLDLCYMSTREALARVATEKWNRQPRASVISYLQ